MSIDYLHVVDIVDSVKNDDTLEINYNKKQYQFAIPGVIYFTQSISKTYDTRISFDTIPGKQMNVIVPVM